MYIIDEIDKQRASKFMWRKEKNTGYWYSYDKETKIYLHRFITSCPSGKVVDHLNHNKDDNRRCNLRVCTQKENCRNRLLKSNSNSGYTNIYRTENNRYCLQYNDGNKNYTVGYFKTLADALKKKAEVWKTKLGINIDRDIARETMKLYQIDDFIIDYVLRVFY